MKENDMIIDGQQPVVIAMPVKGEWLTPNTPGSRIPSHGTNKLATRYAYDFIQVNWAKKGHPSYRVSFMHYILFGTSIRNYYCWGQRVYAPCDGIVIDVKDGYKERKRTHLLPDLFRAMKNARHFDPKLDDPQIVAGNYIILQFAEHMFVALCHLKTNSIQVAIGQRVTQGMWLGEVGHSGNSFGPHLHMQVMDHPDLTVAKAVPCCFERYEVYKYGEWKLVVNGIPSDKEHIRFL